MAKQSVIKSIRGKSKTAYPTNGASPAAIRAIQKLQKVVVVQQDDDELERKAFHGGFKGRPCGVCFVKKSVSGACNC